MSYFPTTDASRADSWNTEYETYREVPNAKRKTGLQNNNILDFQDGLPCSISFKQAFKIRTTFCQLDTISRSCFTASDTPCSDVPPTEDLFFLAEPVLPSPLLPDSLSPYTRNPHLVTQVIYINHLPI